MGLKKIRKKGLSWFIWRLIDELRAPTYPIKNLLSKPRSLQEFNRALKRSRKRREGFRPLIKIKY